MYRQCLRTLDIVLPGKSLFPCRVTARAGGNHADVDRLHSGFFSTGPAASAFAAV